jgi:hypothetical protein
VDDLITFMDSLEQSDQLQSKLQNKFDIKVIGEPSMLLGIKISHDISNGTITLSQSHYIEMILKRFGLTNANPVSTPLDLNVKLSDDKHKTEPTLDG